EIGEHDKQFDAVLSADPRQFFRFVRGALRIVAQAPDVDLVPERMDGVWEMARIASEAHPLLDQLVRALEIACQPRRKTKVDPCCYTSVERELFSDSAVPFPIVGVQRCFEVFARR